MAHRLKHTNVLSPSALEAFARDGICPADIGHRLGIQPSVVERRYRLLGIKPHHARASWTRAMEDRLVELSDGRRRWREIARLIREEFGAGVSIRTVEAHVRAAGLPRRRTGGRNFYGVRGMSAPSPNPVAHSPGAYDPRRWT